MSAFVVDTHELRRQPGASRAFELEAPAPADLGLDVIGVREGSPVRVDGLLESVLEGVLASGTVTADIHGECVRCLTDIDYTAEGSFSELFVYDDQPFEEDDSRLVGDLLDLETVVRDAVVLDLPTNPLCKPDCLGLCPECGFNLNDDPAHEHDAPIDPRWSALRTLKDDDDG